MLLIKVHAGGKLFVPSKIKRFKTFSQKKIQKNLKNCGNNYNYQTKPS